MGMTAAPLLNAIAVVRGLQHSPNRPPRPAPTLLVGALTLFAVLCSPHANAGTDTLALAVSPQQQVCATAIAPVGPQHPPPPAEAHQRIPESQLVAGGGDVAWVWLGSPTRRYPHGALGSPVHAGSVHALVKNRSGGWTQATLELPLHRVYEDRVPRVLDLDADDNEEILLIEADALRGAALVVLGVDHAANPPRLVERARGPYAGSTFRWLNPAGVADFDGDGHLDLASVVTPHIGGVLQLLHYRPPELVPFARALDVSNHRMGALEQSLSVVVQRSGKRPSLMVPDMTRKALHALRWNALGQWAELPNPVPLPGTIEKLTRTEQGACATLADGSAWAVTLQD